MAEQLFSEQYFQDGGSFDELTFFSNTPRPELAGLLIPPATASGPNNHRQHFLNMLEFLSRRWSSTFKGYVYKADTDGDLEFSVPSFTKDHRGLTYIYAGGTAIGGLVAGATRYIWANLLPDKTVTIEVGAVLPATTHAIILAAIAAPATGPWRPNHITRMADRHGASSSAGQVFTVETPFTYQDVGTISLGKVRAGGRIHRITTVVETAFNGVTPAVKYGDAGDDDRLVATGFVNLTVVEKYIAQPFHLYAAETEVIATLAIGGSPSQGAGTVIMEHS